MTAPLPQGELPIERMCALAGVSRAGYYRHWGASAPRQEETGVRDAIQRLALEHPHYGYRRIAAQLRRDAFVLPGRCVKPPSAEASYRRNPMLLSCSAHE